MRIFLISIAMSASLLSFAEENPDFTEWETKTLKELEAQKGKDPKREFTFYMAAGRELAGLGEKAKARAYFQKAYDSKTSEDKTEAVIELVNLARDDKAELKTSLARAQDWFKTNPKKLSKEITSWLALMESHASGKTNTDLKNSRSFWASDKRIEELMREGKASEALSLTSGRDIRNANMSEKIRFDLLNASVSGVKNAPPSQCKPTLTKYPKTQTWSMKICRFLEDKREGKKSSETLAGIEAQLKSESPERLGWLNLLRTL